jgi:hypothetical protein
MSSIYGGFTGSFKVGLFLTTDVSKLLILVRSVNHSVDADEDDSLPGILLSNLVIKVNGVANSAYDLVSGNMDIDGGNYVLPVFVSTDSLSFDDTDYNGIFVNPNLVNLYSDSSISGGGVIGDVLEISGNLTLNDGSNGPYIPGNQGGMGMIQFTTTSSGNDNLQVFLDPTYDSVASGFSLHGARTTVGSSIITLN